jgi:ribosome-binding factor A
MAQGSRPDRVGEQIRQELSQIIARQLHDPGVGFVTLTRVKVTADLQLARVLYTVLGDEKQKTETQKALERSTPFLRREIGSRIRLRRVPELQFFYDKAIEQQDRIEQILLDIKKEDQARQEAAGGGVAQPEAAGRGVYVARPARTGRDDDGTDE